jgi:hypothetical protein
VDSSVAIGRPPLPPSFVTGTTNPSMMARGKLIVPSPTIVPWLLGSCRWVLDINACQKKNGRWDEIAPAIFFFFFFCFEINAKNHYRAMFLVDVEQDVHILFPLSH